MALYPRSHTTFSTESSERPFWSRPLTLVVLLIGLGLLVLVGRSACRPGEPDISRENPISISQSSSETSLQQALDLLNRMDEFDQAVAHDEIVKHLRQWWSRQSPDTKWTVDPLLQQLPTTYRGMARDELLAQGNFEPYDVQVLQEATWLRDLSRGVLDKDVPSPEIADLLAEISASVERSHAHDLSRAVLLFDWTVRNLQLDSDVQPGDTHRLNSDVILQSWESLLFGRGTLAEKSRVFVLLCRQLGMPAVMLAIDRSTAGERPTIWLPALLLDKQLYLFEMRLGIPVPGPDNRGVATLEQVIGDPKLLERLGLAGDVDLLNSDDLAHVVALIDATPANVSQRMQLLESALVGNNRLVLTTSPSQIAGALSESPGVQGVGIWTLPYDGFVVRSRLQRNQAGVIGLALEHSLFDRQRTPLAPARILQFRGKYESDDEGPGARALYLECRASQEQIRSLGEIPFGGADGGATPPATDEQLAVHKQRLATIQQLMRRTKENASYWLGLMAFDRGEYGVSIDFLDKRLQKISPDTIWRPGAAYNLGRAYEARGHKNQSDADLRLAQQWYESLKDSPVAAACRWRALRLRQDLAPDEAPPDNDKSSAQTSDATEIRTQRP
jgi:hypothetical protein